MSAIGQADSPLARMNGRFEGQADIDRTIAKQKESNDAYQQRRNQIIRA
jgi:hypothetical protein